MSDETTKRNETPTQIGNAAKLRAALKEIIAILNNCAIEHYWDSKMLDICSAALSAPPRNCDRFATEEDANAAFDKMCDLRGDGLRSCIGCKYNGGERGGFPSISRCRVAWLFDTATPEEGGEP